MVYGHFVKMGNEFAGCPSTAAAHPPVAEYQQRDTPTGRRPVANGNKKTGAFTPLPTFTFLPRPKNGVASNRQLAEAASLRLLIFQSRPAGMPCQPSPAEAASLRLLIFPKREEDLLRLGFW